MIMRRFICRSFTSCNARHPDWVTTNQENVCWHGVRHSWQSSEGTLYTVRISRLSEWMPTETAVAVWPIYSRLTNCWRLSSWLSPFIAIMYVTWHTITMFMLGLKGHSHEKYTCFLFRFNRQYEITNIFNTLHHKIIYDERHIWMNKMLNIVIAFINGNLMTSLVLL